MRQHYSTAKLYLLELRFIPGLKCETWGTQVHWLREIASYSKTMDSEALDVVAGVHQGHLQV